MKLMMKTSKKLNENNVKLIYNHITLYEQERNFKFFANDTFIELINSELKKKLIMKRYLKICGLKRLKII